jgi:hypothetical protein
MTALTISKFAVAAAALCSALSASAQVASDRELQGNGPLPYASVKVATPQGYGSGTVYYPKSGSNYGLIVISPGFTEGQGFNDQWGPRLASWGFVAVNIGTKTVLDLPPSRADQMWAALQQVIKLSKGSTVPFAGKVDASRLGAMGHSMGGGGTLLLSQAHPEIKAAIPMAAWNLPQKTFPKITVPTILMACENDIIAPVSGHVNRFWSSFNSQLPRILAESKGQDHFCTTDLTSKPEKAAFGRLAIAWYKAYIDGERQYLDILRTSSSPAFSRYEAKGF